MFTVNGLGAVNSVTLNDVVEHMQPERLGCLFQTLKRLSHPGTAAYFHVPSPEIQLTENGQYFENVLPHHINPWHANGPIPA